MACSRAAAAYDPARGKVFALGNAAPSGPLQLFAGTKRGTAWRSVNGQVAVPFRPSGAHVFDGDRILLLGGQAVKGDFVPDVIGIHVETGEASPLPPLPETIGYRPGCARVGRSIFAASGIVRGVGDRPVTMAVGAGMLDPREGAWQQVPSLRSGRCAPLCAATGDAREVWVLGGLVEPQEATRAVDIFDVRGGRWRDGPKLHRKRAFGHALWMEGGTKLLVFGNAPRGAQGLPVDVPEAYFVDGADAMLPVDIGDAPSREFECAIVVPYP